MTTTEVGVGYVRLLPSMRGFSAAAAREMDSGLVGPAKQAGRTAGDGFVSSFGSTLEAGGRSMSGFGDMLTVGLTVPLLAASGAAFKMSKDFNEGMANIATLIPGNTERVGELKTGIRDLSIEMGKSTGDMTEGMYNVISAFGDSDQSFRILDTNARAARAGMADTADAISLTSAVTKGYGDTSADAVAKAADLALLTVRMGQTTFPELAGSVGQVIPIAQNLGVTQEELFASMAAFTGVTGSASEVATQMRGAMQGLLSPTADARAAIEAAGFASGEAAVEELGLAGAVGILTDAATASGTPLQKFLGSVEGQTFALGLAGAQADDYQTKLAAMAGAAGTTDEAFHEATQGVNASGFAYEQAKIRAQVMGQQLGDGLAPAIIAVLTAAEPLVETVSSLAARFADADPSTQKLILGAVGVVAAFGPMLSIFGRVATAVGGTIRGVAALGRGAATTARFGASMAGGVGRAAVAFAHLGRAALTAGAQVATAAARMVAAAAKAAARVVAQIAVQIAKWVLLGVQSLIHAAKVALAWVISLGPIGILVAAVVAAVALIIANWDRVSAFIVAAAEWVWEKVKAVFGAIRDWVRDRIDDIVGFFSGLPGRIAGFVLAIHQHHVAVFGAIRDWVRARIDDVVGFFSRIPGRVAGFVRAIHDRHVAVFSAIRDWVRARIDDVVGFFSGLPGRVAGFVLAIHQRHVAVFGAIRDWVRDRLDDIVRFFAGLPGRVGSAVASIADPIVKPFRDAFNAIKRLWNETIGGRGFNVPKWVPTIGGKGFRIPKMHTGGIFGAPSGRSEGLALLRDGEGVFTRDQMAALGSGAGSGAASQVVIELGAGDDELLRWLRRQVRVRGGGDVQTALGQR